MSEEELIPLITYYDGIKRLFFHRVKTDELYILKNIGYGAIKNLHFVVVKVPGIS